MKAILEFNLDDFDDKLSHLRAVNSTSLALFIWDIKHNLKKKIDHKISQALEEDKNITPHDSLEIIYDEIHGLLAEYGIDIDSLIM